MKFQIRSSDVIAMITGLQLRQGDRAEALPGGGAVDGRRLVQVVRDRLEAGEERDRRLRHAGPDADEDHGRQRPLEV